MTEEVIEPSTNPKSIKTTEVKEFSAEDELENLKAENEKLKTELAASPADSPINTNKFSSEKTCIVYIKNTENYQEEINSYTI